MKKVFLGCGITSAIILIIVIYAGYRFYRFARDIGLQVKGVSERYETLDMQIPFVKPDDGLITPDQFDTWIQLRVDLSEEMTEMVDSIGNFSIQTIFQIHTRLLIESRIYGRHSRPGNSHLCFVRSFHEIRKIVGILSCQR